jgi:hypothetical protein
MTSGQTERETIKKLRGACRTANQWAKLHASVFDPKKYALMHFVNPKEKDPEYTPLILPETTVQATTTSARYLGFWLDPKLEFNHHRHQAVAKAGISLGHITPCTPWPRGVYVGSIAYGDAPDLPSSDRTTDALWYRGVVPTAANYKKQSTSDLPPICVNSEASSLSDWWCFQNDGCGSH